MDNTEYIGFIPFTDDEPCKSAVGSLCLRDCKTLDTDSIFTQLMTKQTSVNAVWLQIQSSSHPQVCTTCYKSVVKLLLAQLAKWEKVCYRTIITVFCIEKMASCCLGVQGVGKAEVEDTQCSGIISS